MALRTITNSRLVDGAKLDSLPSTIGDMIKTTYDPTNKNTDAFSMENMAETATKKVFTDTERTNLGNQSGTNTGDETDTTIKTKLGITTLSGSNTGDEDVTSIKTKLGITTLSGSNTGDNTVATALTGTPNITVGVVTTTGNIELGHASDTTLSRVSAGVIAVEGTSLPKGTGTTNEITYRSGTNTVGTLAVATYPSLTELSYVKGLTSSAQTQLTARLPLAGGTMTGKIVSAGSSEVAKTYTPATGAQTVALDCAVNNIHEVTGHASGTAITFTVSNVTNSQCFMVSILQGAVVSTITGWFATVRRAGGTAPTLTATVGKRDTFGFRRTGANTYDGFVIGANC